MSYNLQNFICTLCWYVCSYVLHLNCIKKESGRGKIGKSTNFCLKFKSLTFCNTLTISLLLWSVGFSAEIITVSKTGRSEKFLTRFYFKSTKTRDITFFIYITKLQQNKFKQCDWDIWCFYHFTIYDCWNQFFLVLVKKCLKIDKTF